MTDKSAAAIREFAEKYMVGTPYTLMYKKGRTHIINNNFLSDLTALISEHYYPKEFIIAFVNWLDKLEPHQRVSVWSKNGEWKGLFTMDNEQLLEKFKERIWKENCQ